MHSGMADYYGLWRGFIFLFGVLPFVVGAGAGVFWALWRGRRGAELIPAALIGGAGLCLAVFVGAVLIFRA